MLFSPISASRFHRCAQVVVVTRARGLPQIQALAVRACEQLCAAQASPLRLDAVEPVGE
jgi:hypothetical protein